MTAGCDEAHQGKPGTNFGVNAFLQPRGVNVALQVVDAHEWEVVCQRHALCGVHSDEQRSRESRAVGHGHAVEFGKFHARLFERTVHDWDQGPHMFTGCDFRDDSAVAGMHLHLCRDDVGDYVPSVLNDGGGSFVAGRFYSEDFHSWFTFTFLFLC